MRLLVLFYQKLKVRLIIFQGYTCRYVHTPSDWESRSKDEKHTVVLNCWSNHVFTYDPEIADIPFQARPTQPLADVALTTLRDERENYNYAECSRSTGHY